MTHPHLEGLIEVRAVLAEMRERHVARHFTSPTLIAWADRIETAIAALPGGGVAPCTPNDYVLVKLNAHGLEVLRNRHDNLRALAPKAISEWSPPATDANGYSRHQLWGLFSDLGPSMGAGGWCLFDDIRFPTPNPHEADQ